MRALIVWRWRRWRARHYLLNAEVDHRRQYTPASMARVVRAADHLRQVEAAHP
jgi:hypothetical protein